MSSNTQGQGVRIVLGADPKPLIAGVNEAANATRQSADVMREAMRSASATTEISAKQMQAALRGVPAQFTDIAVSLASGQAPLTVLMQQGGQLKDMFGGAGNAARALGGYVLGLVNPLTVVAGSAAMLAVAFESGSSESRSLQNAIINSGNAAGVTKGQLMGMAAGVDAVVGTQGRAVEVLGAMVDTGKVGAAHLQEFTTAAMRFEAVGGAAAEDTAKAFAELGKAPLEGSLKLNESMHYLTASTYEQIKALVDQGKHTEAVAVAQKALADTINGRSKDMAANLGLVEKAWMGIRNVVSETWDAIKSIGRDTGSEGALKSAQSAVDALQAQLDARKSRGLAAGDIESRLAAAKALVDTKQQEVLLQQRGATAQAEQVALTEKMVAWDKEGVQFESNRQKREQAVQKAREEGQALINAGKLTEKQLAERIVNIQEKYADKTKTGDTELANLVARVAAEKQNLALLQNQGLHYVKINEGERTALQLAEQLTGKLDAKTRKSKEAQLVQAKILADVLTQQEAERKLQQTRQAAVALDEKLTGQQVAQYQQSIDQLVTGNAQLRTEIDLVGKDTAARRVYLAAKAEELVKAKELEVINLRNSGARDEVIIKAEQELRLLRDKASLTGQVNSALDGQAAKDMLLAIQRETEALSQTNEQRQVTIALRELEAKGIKAGTAAYEEYIPKIKAAIANKAAAEQAVSFWTSVENVAHDAWNHIGEQGESAAHRIERALKAGVWDMLWQITGRRWLIDIGTSIGIPGAALAQRQAGSLFGTASNAASLYNAGNSLFGMGGVASSAGILSGASYGTSAFSAQSIMLAGQEVGGTIGSAMITGAQSASSILSVAFDPITLGIAGLVGVLASMDNSGTPHMGGSAIADSVTGIHEMESALIGFGLSASDVSSKVVTSSKQLAGSALSILQGLDALGGGKNKFSVATGFADDSSSDGAWGSLAITRNGKSLVDWRDTQTSRWAPKEFANGEAGAKEYGNALAAGIKQAIDQIDLPDWAGKIVKSMGDTPTMDELSATLAKIQAMPEQALQAIGSSSQALAGIIYTGMQTSDPAGAGAAFAGQITYGIEASLYQGFANQITGIVTTQLVTPVVTAMASRATLTEAMATASIDTMKAQVSAAGAAFAAIVNDPGFKDALASVNTLIASSIGSSIEGFAAPTAPAAYTGMATAAAAVAPAAAAASAATADFGNAVDTLAQQFAQATDSLTTTGADLAVQLLRAQGNEAAALAAERTQYLAQYTSLGRAEQDRIAQLYDANQAIKDQIDAINKQKQAVSGYVDSLQSSLGALLSATAQRGYSAYSLVAKAVSASGMDGLSVGQIFGQVANLSQSQIKANAMAFASSKDATLQAKAAVLELAGGLLQLSSAAEQAYKSAEQNLANAWLAIAQQTVASENAIINGVVNAQQAVDSALQASATSLRTLAKDIRTFVADLDATDSGGLNPGAQYAAAQAAYSILQAQALAGDTTAQGKLTAAAQKVLDTGKATTATQADYLRIVASIKNGLDAVASQAEQDAKKLSPLEQGITDLAKAQDTLIKWQTLAADAGISTERIAQAQLSEVQKARAEWVKATDLQTAADRIVTQYGYSASTITAAMKGLQDGTIDQAKALDGVSTAIGDVAKAASALTVDVSAFSGIENSLTTTVGGIGAQILNGLTPLERAIIGLTGAIGRINTAPVTPVVGTTTGGTSYPMPSISPDYGSYTSIVAKYGQETINTAGTQLMSIIGSGDQAALVSSVSEAIKQGVTSSDLAALLTSNGLTISSSDLSGWAVSKGLPSFDVGINRVPYDMTANIHQGEAVIPAKFNPFNPGSESWGGNADAQADMLAELKALRAELAELRQANSAENAAIAGSSLRSAKVLEAITPDGDALATRTAKAIA